MSPPSMHPQGSRFQKRDGGVQLILNNGSFHPPPHADHLKRFVIRFIQIFKLCECLQKTSYPRGCYVKFLAVFNTREPGFSAAPDGPIPYFPKPRPYFSKSFISRNPILFPEIVDLHGLDSGASCFAAPQARKILGFLQPRKEETLNF